ncbi:RTA1 domain-containing protein [Rhizoctonia solani AG-1 IA]|uniref:RTA1 domain-containing protein n=1 Tax=Thanatephorus cucumeris (strain AG1-IA) TaxID=983506 RepID=L8WQ08_THACA|nr:RTA1 domain-containing protein [Rhizoctonia solani AG-1 IA]
MADRITTTIIAPSFMTAAMFLILPKIINELGTMYSRMPPRLYSIIFITADVTALIIQAAGGAMASVARTPEGSERGGKIMLGGIVIQLTRTLVAVILYTILGLEFVIRFSYDRPAHPKIISDLRKNSGWVGVPRGIVKMLTGLAIATVFIIIRSIYRTIELTDGWNGTIISTESYFNWFDGAPIFVAMFVSVRSFDPVSGPHRGSIIGINRKSQCCPVQCVVRVARDCDRPSQSLEGGGTEPKEAVDMDCDCDRDSCPRSSIACDAFVGRIPRHYCWNSGTTPASELVKNLGACFTLRVNPGGGPLLFYVWLCCERLPTVD